MSSLADHVAQLKEHWGQRHTSLYAALCQTMVEAHLPELERLVAAKADAEMLAGSLEGLLSAYLSNVDAYRTGGFYSNPEKDEEVIDARHALATYREKN